MSANLSRTKRRSGLAQLFSDLTQRTGPIATAATGSLDAGGGSSLADRAASVYGSQAADRSRPAPATVRERSPA